MNTIEILILIFIILAIAMLTFVTKNYFKVNRQQISKSDNLDTIKQDNSKSKAGKDQYTSYMSNSDLHVSGSVTTDSNNSLSRKKFDGINLNPKHENNNKSINEAEVKEISDAAKKGKVFDIANESAINQPQDKIK